MLEKILCVDDDANILAAFKRQLRKQFVVDAALGGEEGLEKLRADRGYAVVLSDLRMPGMDGISFLAKARELSPQSTRVMLTGHADLQVAMDAVNEGNIFRFLTKPCPHDILLRTLEAAAEQYRLVRAEKELLEHTLSGSIKILTEILALANPTAFARASRVRKTVKQLCRELRVANAWEVEVAAMLCQVGCVAIPEETMQKINNSIALDPHETQMLHRHPQLGRDLISRIPRLQGVAEIIYYQNAKYDGSDGIAPAPGALPLGARILKVALDIDALVFSNKNTWENALIELVKRKRWYDEQVLDVLSRLVLTESGYEIKSVRLNELEIGTMIAEDIRGKSGVLLIAAGQEVTQSLQLRMQNYAAIAGIADSIKVKAKKC